ncbi:hypothetical protein [Anaerococcus degeneri]|uniref:DUF948 domain-containing protein n=1 Tax=Anaerococcus degeneri TaxID=361500 RepID=A0ABS7YZM4_9FIRM|nr:hypothetical protein [Anaerococcus degeneri]MBP2014968.1 uncharacterized protein YoxC [Anaerococcus degeneri]MCA2097176.1 hypothetical protein [Anaerococcus degeneri]
MSITIDFNLLGNIIISILAILALIFLVLVLVKVNKLLGSVQEVLNKNSSNIDNVITKLPHLTNEATSLVENVNSVVTDPNLKMAIAKVNDTMTSVNSIADDVKDTVNYVGITAVDSVDTFGAGVASITDYSSLIIDVIDIVKNVIAG